MDNKSVQVQSQVIIIKGHAVKKFYTGIMYFTIILTQVQLGVTKKKKWRGKFPTTLSPSSLFAPLSSASHQGRRRQ